MIFIIFIILLIIFYLYYSYKFTTKNNKFTTKNNKFTTKNNNNINNLFNDIKIYRFGINNIKKDINKAKNILNHIINNGNDTQKAKSLMILNDINVENNNIKWFFPHKNNKNNKFDYYEPKISEINYIDENEIKLQESLLNSYKNININVFDKPQIPNDNQNVHDHIVVRSVAQSLQSISQNINDIESTTEFINFKNNLDDNTKITLNKMLSNVEKISSYNLSEYEIFVKVWNTIINHNNKNELLNILKLQLIDSYEMCSIGRANRIIQTLEGFDNNISIKPEWAILTEMNNSASKIFNNLLTNSLYTNIMETEDEILINNFKNEYKNLLLMEFNRYNNLLSIEYINTKINEYLQVF